MKQKTLDQKIDQVADQIAEEVAEKAVALIFDGWDDDGIDNEDLLIPKILLQQKTSDWVEQGVAKPGDFVDSIEGAVLGGAESPVEIVVFDVFKTWVVKENGQYSKTEPFTVENSTAPYQEGNIERIKTFNFYCILASGEETGLPYVLSLSRTSTKAARTIVTAIKKLRFTGKPMGAKTFLLSCHKESNDKGSWFVVDARAGRDSTEKEVKAAYSWYQNIRKGVVKAQVHEAEVEVRAPKSVTVPIEDDELAF